MARHAREVRRDAYCIACFRGPFQLTWRMAFLERRQFCALAEMLFVGWVYTLIHRVRITDTPGYMAYDPRRFHDPDRPFRVLQPRCSLHFRCSPPSLARRIADVAQEGDDRHGSVAVILAETLPRSHCGKPIQLLELDCPVQVLWAYAETVDATTSEPQPGTTFCVSPNPHPDPTDTYFVHPERIVYGEIAIDFLRGSHRKHYSSVVLSICGPHLLTKTSSGKIATGSVVAGIWRC